MRIAFVVYDGMTMLDFIGAYDPLTRLRTMGVRDDVTWDICARGGEVTEVAGLRVSASSIGVPLSGYELVYIPGGFSVAGLLRDAEMIAWLRTAAGCPLLASVCTGSLLLGAAGFLKGRRATTHPTAFADLAPYCAEVLDERIVDTGDVVTARGVSSSLDLGLYLVERVAGSEARARIQRQMDYPYYPFAHS